MRILSVDPGERTGIALLEVLDDEPPRLIFHDEVYGGVEGFIHWWDTRPDYDVLIAEDYVPRPGTPQTNSTAPQRVLGFLSPWHPVVQNPAGRLKAVSNEVLKRLGLYLPGEPLRNAREAVRHGVIYLKRQRHLPTIRAGWS